MYRFLPCLLGIIIIALGSSNQTQAFTGIAEPVQVDEKDYSEYWEQYFLFENNALLTSQFLITNLPFSKHHGIMIATLKEKNTRMIMVKNGRQKKGWGHNDSDHALHIFQHRLQGTYPGFLMQLHNTAAEIDLIFSPEETGMTIIPENNDAGLPFIHQYAPAAHGYARWRAGPEIGGNGPSGAWQILGNGFGAGLHVIQRRPINETLESWFRFTSTQGSQRLIPILHIFQTRNGEQHLALLLVNKFGETLNFRTGTITIDKNVWLLNLKNDKASLHGQITIEDSLNVFTLKDHLNGLEQIAAGSAADIERFYDTAKYQLSLKTGNTSQKLEGKAFTEKIMFGTPKQKRKRFRR